MAIRTVDVAVVDAARSGDRAAIEALLAQCQPDLRRFARRTCSTAEDVEDAVQEAMWALYRRVGALRTLSALSGWLFQVVRRECLRLERRVLRRASAGELDEAADVEFDIGTSRDLSAAVAGLEPIYRDVLILRDVREMTGPEASRELGISLAATKSRLHRGRALLRASLHDYRRPGDEQ